MQDATRSLLARWNKLLFSKVKPYQQLEASMALPYYMSPSYAPAMSSNDFYPSPVPLIDQCQQIQHQQFVNTELAHQNLSVPHSYIGYENELTTPPYLPTFRPSMPNIVKQQPRLATQDARLSFPLLPNMIYPNVPLTNQVPSPHDYSSIYEPRRCYLSELKTAAERVAASDATSSWSQPKPLSEPELDLRVKKQKLEPKPVNRVVVTPDDSAVPKTGAVPKNTFISPVVFKNYLENRFGLCYDMTLLRNPTLRKLHGFGDDFMSGPGQEYISKIRTLVEGGDSYTAQPRKINEPIADFITVTTKCKKRKNSDSSDSQEFSKYLRYDLYPRTVPLNPGHWFLGKNGTFVPASFYESISWNSTMECTKRLMEFIFDDGSLATHSLDGENSLDPAIVDDVIDHVSNRCFVKRQHVRSTIMKICSDAASQRFKNAS